MDITHQEQQPTGEEDKDGKPIMHTVNVTAPETVNSMVPIWQRAKTEVTDDECVAWYKETNRDQTDPAAVLRINAEGVVSYKALLFIPGKDIDNGISGAAKKGPSSSTATACSSWRTATSCCTTISSSRAASSIRPT